MAGAGLYQGIALSGACSSPACTSSVCAQGQAGPLSSCGFGESYSGTIEIRVVR